MYMYLSTGLVHINKYICTEYRNYRNFYMHIFQTEDLVYELAHSIHIVLVHWCIGVYIYICVYTQSNIYNRLL